MHQPNNQPSPSHPSPIPSTSSVWNSGAAIHSIPAQLLLPPAFVCACIILDPHPFDFLCSLSLLESSLLPPAPPSSPPSLCDTIDTRLQTDDFESSACLHCALGYVRQPPGSSSPVAERETKHLGFGFVHCICTIARIAPTQDIAPDTPTLDSGGDALGEAGSGTVNHHMP